MCEDIVIGGADNGFGATPAKSLDYCVFVRIARLRIYFVKKTHFLVRF